MAPVFEETPNIGPRSLLDDDTEHYAALGRFVTMYAMAEAAAHVLTRNLSGLDDEMARLVFGDKRLADIVGYIRKLLPKARYADDFQARVFSCIDQLNVLSEARNKFAHRLVDIIDDETMIVSNEALTKAVSNAETDTFSITDLQNMWLDCQKISRTLALADTTSPLSSFFVAGSTPSWHYKPLRPNSARQRRREAAQSGKRQPPPDRKKHQKRAKD